jgi:hypothetical protein
VSSKQYSRKALSTPHKDSHTAAAYNCHLSVSTFCSVPSFLTASLCCSPLADDEGLYSVGLVVVNTTGLLRAPSQGASLSHAQASLLIDSMRFYTSTHSLVYCGARCYLFLECILFFCSESSWGLAPLRGLIPKSQKGNTCGHADRHALSHHVLPHVRPHLPTIISIYFSQAVLFSRHPLQGADPTFAGFITCVNTNTLKDSTDDCNCMKIEERNLLAIFQPPRRRETHTGAD